jgi:hypothetical protein
VAARMHREGALAGELVDAGHKGGV